MEPERFNEQLTDGMAMLIEDKMEDKGMYEVWLVFCVQYCSLFCSLPELRAMEIFQGDL